MGGGREDPSVGFSMNQCLNVDTVIGRPKNGI